MKRFADAREPPIVVPVVVIAIDVHVALVVPAVEGGNIVQNAIHATTQCKSLRQFLGCIVFRIIMR